MGEGCDGGYVDKPRFQNLMNEMTDSRPIQSSPPRAKCVPAGFRAHVDRRMYSKCCNNRLEARS